VEYILFAFLALLASSGNTIFNKLGANKASAITNAVLKSFFMVIACFFICLALGHVPTLYSLSKEQWLWLSLVGVLMAVDWLFYFLAIKRSHLEAFAPFCSAGTLFFANTLFIIFTYALVTNGGKSTNVALYFVGLALLLAALIYTVFNKKINPKAKTLWVIFALVSVIAFAFVLLIVKTKLSDLPSDVVSFHQTSILFVIMLITSLFTRSIKEVVTIKWKVLLFIFIGAVFNALMVVLKYTAFSYANSIPAIVNVIVGLDFVIVSLATVLFFKSKNKLQLLLIIILVSAGMILNTLAGLI